MADRDLVAEARAASTRDVHSDVAALLIALADALEASRAECAEHIRAKLLAMTRYAAAKAECARLREALLGLRLDEALTFEGNIDAHVFFSVDALNEARAALAQSEREQGEHQNGD